MIEDESVESALDDLIVALTEEVQSLARNKPNDLIILVAYILSDLFGSAPGSRSWH